MKGIYLAAFKAYHPEYDITYQDINGKRDIAGDMLDIDLSLYDYVIATPPCNFWSRARGSKDPSDYAVKTAHLLPDIIRKLSLLNKPFIVENVRNEKKFNLIGLFNYKNIWVYRIGRHTYWTNRPFYTWLNQNHDFATHGLRLNNNTQGGDNVHIVIDRWLKELHENQV